MPAPVSDIDLDGIDGGPRSLEEVVQRWFSESQQRLVEEAECFMHKREMQLCSHIAEPRKVPGEPFVESVVGRPVGCSLLSFSDGEVLSFPIPYPECFGSKSSNGHLPPQPSFSLLHGPCPMSGNLTRPVGDADCAISCAEETQDDEAFECESQDSRTGACKQKRFESKVVFDETLFNVQLYEPDKGGKSTSTTRSGTSKLSANILNPEPVSTPRYSRFGSVFALMGIGDEDGSHSQNVKEQHAQEILATLKVARINHLRRNDNKLDLDAEVQTFSGWMHSPDAERKLDKVMAVIVLLNISQLGASADIARSWDGWLVCDFFFAVAFAFEFFSKWFMRGTREHFLLNWKWTTFDGIIVGVAIIELISNIAYGSEEAESNGGASISVLRVVRLLRLVRIIKALKLPIFKDLLMMLDGLIGGARTLFWSFILLMVPIFASALMLRETVGENKESEFSPLVKPFTTLPNSFFTIFRCIMGDCSAESGQPLPVLIADSFGWGFAFSYICLIVITSFGLFNVIIAIYVENIVVAAKKNESIQRQRRLRDTRRLNLLLAELIGEFMAASHTGVDAGKAATLEITRGIFEEVLKKESVNFILEQLEIPFEDRMDLFDVLDADGSGHLTLGEILEGLKRLRGEPRRSDIIALGLAIRAMQKRVHTDTEQIFQVLRRCALDIRNLTDDSFSSSRSVGTAKTSFGNALL